MDFKRKKQRGQKQHIKRQWLSPEGYRIVWRKAVFGVTVPPAYQACVETQVWRDGWHTIWDLVDKPLYRTLKRAQKACEKHRHQWEQACGIRELKRLFGRVPTRFPKWVHPSDALLRLLEAANQPR